MTNPFWSGETYAIVKAMKAAGNRPGIIAQWKKDMEQWVTSQPVNNLDAQAVRSWLPLWQVRPIYTAWELAPIWPALAIAVGHTSRWPAVLKSARRLEFELDFAKLPSREVDGKRYFIVERLHHWRNASQEDIEHAVHGR